MKVFILLLALTAVFGQFEVFRKTTRTAKANSAGSFTMDN